MAAEDEMLDYGAPEGNVDDQAPADHPDAQAAGPAEAMEHHDEQTGAQDPLSMPPHGTEVFISKIPREAADHQLKAFCEQSGEVFATRLPKDPGNAGQNKGYAFAVYKSKEGATLALTQLNQTELPDFPGRKVTLVRSEVKNKLFIGNLPREMNKDGLLATLEVEVKGIEGIELMMEKETDMNRGFGFVEFYNHAAAEAARRRLSRPDFRIHDRQVTVTWAEPKKNEALLEQVKSIYVGNLPVDSADEHKLRGIFSAYGKITGVSLLKDPMDPNRLRNYCFIHYEERASALKAVEDAEATKHEMDGNELVVHMAKPQVQRDNMDFEYSGYNRGYGSYGTQSYSRPGYGQPAGRGSYGMGRGGMTSTMTGSTGYGRGAGRTGIASRGGMSAGRGTAAAPRAAAATYYDEGYGEEGYGEEDYGYEDYGTDYSVYGTTGFGYSGYPAGVAMMPMMMPGGQIGYVMTSGMGATAGTGGAVRRYQTATTTGARGMAAASAGYGTSNGAGYGSTSSGYAAGYGSTASRGAAAAGRGVGRGASHSTGAAAYGAGSGGYGAGRGSSSGYGTSSRGASASGGYGGRGASRYAPY